MNKQKKWYSTKTMTRSKIHLLLGMVCLASSSLFATTVIKYDGIEEEYVSSPLRANEAFQLPDAVDTESGIRTWKYVEGAEPLVAPSGLYTGPELFGALQINSVVNGIYDDLDYRCGIGAAKVYAPASTLGMTVREEQTITCLFFFKPQVTEGQSVHFDNKSAIIATFTGAVQNLNSHIRVVFKSKKGWFISSDLNFISGQEQYLEPFFLSWAKFDPTNVAPLPSIDKISGFESLSDADFAAIEAVGFYADQLSRDANNPYFHMDQFVVEATVTP